VRIVAGEYRGRTLKAPPGTSTRPTADRVREALFSILGSVEGARVLDLYAGSGAVGIEALSRGAAHATFVERDRRAASVIEHNVASVGAGDRATVLIRDALAWLAAREGKDAFDLVLIDPPYDFADRLGGPLTGHLPGVLAPNAVIVSESDKRSPLLLDLPEVDERHYGDTRIAIHRT
jgi:16S rRNA (guanine966-N2)-methyltransferase